MVGVVHQEETEIIMDYVNLPNAPDRSHKQTVFPASQGRKIYRLVGVSLGLLFVLQAAINVSLRLVFYRPDTQTQHAVCRNMTKDDMLKQPTAAHYIQQGWLYFHQSFYYVSSTRKTWHDSRRDCLSRGADLLVINTIEEQDFARQFYRLTWIGLRDGKMTGRWLWVDGTPLTKSYWGTGEPNGYEGKNENCVEIRFHEDVNSWNDIPCQDQNFWICEKKAQL